MEGGVGQEGGCPVGEAAAGPGLEKGLGGGWQRGWGGERDHKCSDTNVTYFVQCGVT